VKKASLADIASALSVSKSLVSIVLNGRGDELNISPDTQKRVHAKAKELHYVPNVFAKGLKEGKSHTIGLLVSDISNEFYARLCKIIEGELRHSKYHLMICNSDEDVEREKELLETLINRSADGIIVSTGQKDKEMFKRIVENGTPVVFIDRDLPNSDVDYVGVDNIGGTEEVITHLAGLGYQRIGLITVGPTHVSTINDRITGYKNALKNTGLKYSGNLVKEVSADNLMDNVREAVKELLMSPNQVNAIFAINNHVASTCLEVFNEMKLKVPQDIALVCFDDSPVMRLSYPPVTVIAQPVDQIGVEASKLILNRINQKGKDVKTDIVKEVLDVELIIRRSCGDYLKNL